MADASSGPLDEEVLRTIQARLSGDGQFDQVEFEPSPERIRAVVARYNRTLYPETVEAVRLDIRWYIGGDYSIHYVEHAADGTQWECRWDRHHEATGRRHIHPPPDAGPPEPADLPTDYRNVIAMVRTYIDERIETLWESVTSE